MTTLVDVANFVLGSSSKDDLRRVSAAIKARWEVLDAKDAARFRIGDKVWFISKKSQRITGTITKFNAKNIVVEVNPFSTWRVSPSLLNKVEEVHKPLLTV